MNSFEYFIKWLIKTAILIVGVCLATSTIQPFPSIVTWMAGFIVILLGIALWDEQGVKMWIK